MVDRVTPLNDPRAGRLVRPARLSLGAAALALAAAILPGSPADAREPPGRSFVDSTAFGGQSIGDFYAARSGKPLWLRDDGTAGVETMLLLDYLRTADADGLDAFDYFSAKLTRAIRAARGGSPSQLRRAEFMLSQAFVAYVSDLRNRPVAGIVWVDLQLKPKAPGPRQLLETAANALNLESWLAEMGWMHPIYAGLRTAIVGGRHSPAELQVLRLNLERARALPAGSGRHILVNATAARLTMYEDGAIVDSMRVVVGKPKNPTPMMAALIRFTALNPYWFVPPDLAAERIAPNVLKQGLGYLKAQGYQPMADWHDEATILDPATIDWQAVADGSEQVRIRQSPGPANAMGRMKFMFPNAQGIYLHDTPQKELLSEPARMFSGGCVRLEDAARLARWLYGQPLKMASKIPEQKVDLPRPVPVFITYLTVMPSGTELATFPDVYGRDREGLAMLGKTLVAGN